MSVSERFRRQLFYVLFKIDLSRCRQQRVAPDQSEPQGGKSHSDIPMMRMDGVRTYH
jgi:hypothetical protein